jgi:CubicO group peptidase (beta-lactamase class C family)
MTKPITAVAALILVERGLLSLHDPVDRFLPEFKDVKIIDFDGNLRPPQKLPTIKNILTHSSGIGSNAQKLSARTEEDKKTLDSSIAFCVRSGLDFEPESMQAYSGTAAFDVLTKIIEIVSKKDFLQFLKEEIFEPCGMCDTTFIPDQEQRSRMVAMHDRSDGENVEFEMPRSCVFGDIPCTHYLGGAGLVSTLKDYSKFAGTLLHGGRAERGRILKEETLRLLSAPQFYKSECEAWGFGVRVITGASYPYLPVGSFGWSGAYGSHFWVDPANDLFAVFMRNSKVDGGAGSKSAKSFEKAVYSSFSME